MHIMEFTMPDERMIRKFFEIFSAHDLEKMKDFFAEEAEFYFPKAQPLLGRKRILKFFKILFRQYPDLKFKVRRIIIQEDAAAIHWTNKGVSRNKETYENEGATIMETENGKISFITDFFKNTEKF